MSSDSGTKTKFILMDDVERIVNDHMRSPPYTVAKEMVLKPLLEDLKSASTCLVFEAKVVKSTEEEIDALTIDYEKERIEAGSSHEHIHGPVEQNE